MTAVNRRALGTASKWGVTAFLGLAFTALAGAHVVLVRATTGSVQGRVTALDLERGWLHIGPAGAAQDGPHRSFNFDPRLPIRLDERQIPASEGLRVGAELTVRYRLDQNHAPAAEAIEVIRGG